MCRLTRAGHVVHAGGGEQLHGLVSARKSIWRQRKHLAQKPLTSPRGHSHSESAQSDLQTVKPQFLYFKKRWFNSATGYFYLMKQKTQGPWENYENGPHGRHRPRPQGAWPGCPGSQLWSDAMGLLCPWELALRQRPQCYITASRERESPPLPGATPDRAPSACGPGALARRCHADMPSERFLARCSKGRQRFRGPLPGCRRSRSRSGHPG